MKSPRHIGNSWAMWWGVSFGLAFLAAAALSFSITYKLTEEPEYSVSSLR
jgi:hypothetical protein